MSWHTNTLILVARNIGRNLGINRLIASWLQKGYEENYDARLLECMRTGDTVYDVGANVGYYTSRFADRVGASGCVIAFEPSPVNFRRLTDACGERGNVRLKPCGLGNISGHLHFQQGEDSLGATSRVLVDALDGELVEIRAGDDLIASGVQQPNVIKMDVEGFEGEVLEGLANCLKVPAMRAFGIEVHFGILRERGLGHMPQRIETILKTAGFNIVWPDSSHLLATRPA